MIGAFFRLFAIFIVSFGLLAGLVFSLRQIGLQQKYSASEFPVFKKHAPFLVIAMGGPDSLPAFSMGALKQSADFHPSVVLGLKLFLSYDHTWVVAPHKNLATFSTGTGFISSKTWADIVTHRHQNSSEKIVSLDEVFLQFPNRNYYIEIHHPYHPAIPKLLTKLTESKKDTDVIFTSTYMDTTKYLREHSARWPTGASASETSKFRFMTSIFLEPLATLDADFVVTEKLTARFVDELQKRNKFVLLRDAQLEGKVSLEFEVNGILTKRPSNYLPALERQAFYR